MGRKQWTSAPHRIVSAHRARTVREAAQMLAREESKTSSKFKKKSYACDPSETTVSTLESGLGRFAEPRRVREQAFSVHGAVALLLLLRTRSRQRLVFRASRP